MSSYCIIFFLCKIYQLIWRQKLFFFLEILSKYTKYTTAFWPVGFENNYQLTVTGWSPAFKEQKHIISEKTLALMQDQNQTITSVQKGHVIAKMYLSPNGWNINTIFDFQMLMLLLKTIKLQLLYWFGISAFSQLF